MKHYLLLIIISFISVTYSFAQSESLAILPSEKITGVNIKPFIDSLRQKILADTIKFDRKDLKHINGRTVNQKPYSIMITVNMKYNYWLDIVDSKLIKEIVDEILVIENIDSINYISKKNVSILSSFSSKDGWILITLKPKIKPNFEVGGLKYHKGKRRKGGDNFLQRKEGEIMIRT